LKSAKQKKYNPKYFKWPTWKIHLLNWLSVISFLFAITIFIMSQINDSGKEKFCIILGFVFLVAPVLIPMSWWVVRVLLVIFERTTYYPFLYSLYQETSSQSVDLEQQFVSYVLNSTKDYMFEISRVTYQSNQLYISLKKKEAFNLNINDIVIVIDKNDGYFMGQFEITEIRTDVYYAVGTKLIDPLWRSVVREKVEIEMTPNLVAYCKKTGE
jgi:hypothetical protein